MSCAILVYGPIGSGKTCTCLKLVERAKTENIPVGGILSIRVYQDEELIGYDGLAPVSGQVFPLARLRRRVDGPDWFTFSHLKYAFSTKGFDQANRILTRSAEALNCSSIVFVDEFGRLERARLGIHPGAVRVAESLRDEGIVIFACRTDMVGAVEGLVRGRVQHVFRQEPGDVEALWRSIRERIKYPS